MFGLSAGHLLILGVVVLLFGGKKLPELGASLGQGLRAFKGAVEGNGLSDSEAQLVSHQEKEKSSSEQIS